MKKIKVALLANLKENAPHFEEMSEDQWDDLDSEKTIKSIQDAIRAGGNICEFLEDDRTCCAPSPSSSRIFWRSTHCRAFHLMSLIWREDGIIHTKLVNMILGSALKRYRLIVNFG